MSEERFVAIEGKLNSLERGVEKISAELRGVESSLRREMGVMGQELEANLSRQMRVLHEDTIGRIAALAPEFAPIRREFAEADAKLREELDRRLVPLEAQVQRGPAPTD